MANRRFMGAQLIAIDSQVTDSQFIGYQLGGDLIRSHQTIAITVYMYYIVVSSVIGLSLNNSRRLGISALKHLPKFRWIPESFLCAILNAGLKILCHAKKLCQHGIEGFVATAIGDLRRRSVT
jgi:hypothetical protein